MLRFKPGRFEIEGIGGKKVVDGLVCEGLGIHPESGGYGVVHLASGRAVLGPVSSETKAKRVVEALLCLPLNWKAAAEVVTAALPLGRMWVVTLCALEPEAVIRAFESLRETWVRVNRELLAAETSREGQAGPQAGEGL